MGVVIRQSIKATVVTYIGAFIGFLTTMFISTRFLTAEEIGLTRILLEAAMVVSSFALLGVANSGVKFFPYFKTENDYRHNGFFFYMILLPLLGVLIFFTLYCLLQKPIATYFSQNSDLFLDYYYYVLPLAFFIVYQIVFETYSSLLMRIVVPRFVKEVLIRCLIVVVILLYSFDFINLSGLILGYVMLYGIAALVNLIYIARITKISLTFDISFIDKKLRKGIFSYTLFFVFSYLGALIVGKIDVFMISSMEGLAATGIYSIAFFMAAIIEMPARSVQAISQPIVSQAYKNGDMTMVDHYFKRVALNQFLVGSMLFVLLWVNIQNIFALIPNGDIYQAGIWVVLFISLARVFSQFASFSGVLLMISKYYRYYILFVLVLAGLTILTNQWLIPIYGISGAALASFIAIFIHDMGMMFFVSYKLKISPFTWSALKVAILTLLLLLLNYFLPYMGNPIGDGIFRIFILGGLAFGILYRMKISQEMNQVVDKVIQILKNKK